MAAPSNEFAFDEGQARAASERWRVRTPAREANSHALSQGRFDRVESKERLAKRVNRILARQPAAPRAAAAAPERLQEMAGTTVTPEQVTNPLVERVIGNTRDFLAIGYLDQGRMAARSVARVVTTIGNGSMAFGTGFLVSAGLFLTNNHVLPSEAEAKASVAEFDYALDGRQQSLTIHRFGLRPDLFFLTDTGLDFTLVGIEPASKLNRPVSEYGWLPLIAAEGKIIVGEFVNIVQHPRGEMKQVVVRGGKLCDMPTHDEVGAADAFTYYEADTEAGSSGSPVFNDQWEVVALHHSGVPRTNGKGEFLDHSGNVWRRGDDPGRLDWVANEGVRISRLMAFLANALKAMPPGHPGRGPLQGLTSDAMPPAEPAVPANEPAQPDRPGGDLAPHQQEEPTAMLPAPEAATVTVQTSGGALTLTVPLRITIELGGGAIAQPVAPGGPAPKPGPGGALVITENFKPDADYDSRPGFNPTFLGFDMPLPKLDNSVARQAAALKDGSTELKYNHYSVIMNGARRIAFVSAVNVDVDARAQIGREGADLWSYDPRIPKEAQAGAELYRNNPIDKGHLTRRQDGAWGATQDEAQSGNDDTFHWTNCSPQHEVFNQSQKATSQGLLLWGNLENHVTDQAKLNKRRICVFNGPVFRKDDATYRGLQLPRQFWKVIVMPGDGGAPNAVGFVLSQADLIADLPKENFAPGAFAPFQVKISDIESLTRLDFGDLRKHDALNVDGAERFFERDVPAVHISGPGDIVLHHRIPA